MLIGTPIAFCLGISSFATVLYLGLPPLVVFQRVASGVSVFTLMAIPFFIFAGDLMVRGGIASRIVAFAGSLIGHVRGGLGQVNIAASTLFGGISGSAVAEAAAVGGIMIPQMKARGYGADYAVNVTSMAALIALLLPPVAQHDHLLDLRRRPHLDRRPLHRRHHPGPAAGAGALDHRLHRRPPPRLPDRAVPRLRAAPSSCS